MTATPSPSYHTRAIRHARLTRSQIRARISPSAMRILAAISYLLKVGVEQALSHRTIARQAGVGEATVSRLIPALAAEKDSGNTVPFLRRRWDAGARCYLITLLPAPEVRGWYEHEPSPEPEIEGASFTPEAPALLADQHDFLGQLGLGEAEGPSKMDPPTRIATQRTLTPEKAPKEGSKMDGHIFYVHENQLLASSEPVAVAPSGHREAAAAPQPTLSEVPGQPARAPTPVPAPPSPAPSDERIAHMARLGVYAGLARRVLAAQPELTIAAFDEAVRALAGRGASVPPAALAATILARGEQVAAAPGRGQAAPPAERVSNALILRAPIDSQERGLWLSRFRQADSPDARRAVLARFRRECLGLAEPVGSA